MTRTTAGPAATEAQLLLAARSGTQVTDLAATLRENLAGLAAGTPLQTELATAVARDELADVPHLAASEGPAWDLIVTLRGDENTLADALPRFAAMLPPSIDRGRSAVAAGVRHSILPGTGPVRLFFGLRRLARLTQDAFHDYWLNVHADFGRRLIPPYTYHQVHVYAEASAAAAAASGLPDPGLDGIVEVHFPDVPAFVAQLSRPEVSVDALADERNFIDHARSVFHVYRA